MKFCPVCRQKYEDAQNFCLNDGASLEVFSAESQVPTAIFNDLNDLTIKPTEASPTIFSPEQTPSPTIFSPEQEGLTDLFPDIKSSNSISSLKSNSLLIALISIFGTLGVVGIIGGVWFWQGNSQTSEGVLSNSSANSNKNSSNIAKSNSLAANNQTENSKSDKKSSTGNNSNLTIANNNKTENVSVNPTPLENSTVDLQVKLTNLGKTQNAPVSGGSITIQTDGKTLTASTNNAGIAYLKGVSCGKSVRITVRSEDGSGNFTRNLKCGANTAWSYQTNCFVSGKNGGCAIEQIR